jgi:hypothetical protein
MPSNIPTTIADWIETLEEAGYGVGTDDDGGFVIFRESLRYEPPPCDDTIVAFERFIGKRLDWTYDEEGQGWIVDISTPSGHLHASSISNRSSINSITQASLDGWIRKLELAGYGVGTDETGGFAIFWESFRSAPPPNDDVISAFEGFINRRLEWSYDEEGQGWMADVDGVAGDSRNFDVEPGNHNTGDQIENRVLSNDTRRCQKCGAELPPNGIACVSCAAIIPSGLRDGNLAGHSGCMHQATMLIASLATVVYLCVRLF